MHFPDDRKSCFSHKAAAVQVCRRNELLLLLLLFAASCRAVEPGLITQMFCREKARSAEAPFVSQERGRRGERESERNGKIRRTAVL